MEDFALFVHAVISLFKVEFTIYGFTLSWWQVFLWSIVASLLIWFIGRIFSD